MGILDQVLGAQKEITGAAQEQAAPSIAAFDAEAAKTAAAKAEQTRLMKEQEAKAAVIRAEPDPELPDLPVYEKVAPKPEAPDKNPLQMFGQMIPVLAALAGAKTQEASIAALNAGSAAMEAADKNDEDALATAHKDWMSNMETVLKNNQITGQNYTAVINDRRMTMDDKMARLNALATEYGDKLAIAALAAGNPGAIIERQKLLDAAAAKLTPMYTEAQRVEMERARIAEDARQANMLDAREKNRIATGPQVQPNDVVGPIMQKYAAGGWPALNPQETEILTRYNKRLESGGGAIPDVIADAIASTPEPSVVPATRAAGPAPAKAPPAPPPVSMLKEGVVTPLRDKSTQEVVNWTLRGGKAVRVK